MVSLDLEKGGGGKIMLTMNRTLRAVFKDCLVMSQECYTTSIQRSSSLGTDIVADAVSLVFAI